MIVRYMDEGKLFHVSFKDSFVPLVGDCVVVNGIEYLVESRKVDFGERVVYVNVKRVQNEVED